MLREADTETQGAAQRHAVSLGHLIPFLNWVYEGGDRWTLCCRCGGLAQINEDGSYFGPALTDPCSGVQGGYVRKEGEA